MEFININQKTSLKIMIYQLLIFNKFKRLEYFALTFFINCNRIIFKDTKNKQL